MEWKIPPKIKIREALGAIGDKRIEIIENEAKVYSSSKGKFYVVKYSSDNNEIMANDNGSYWRDYLGYPSIAFLMLKGVLSYNPKFTEALKDIYWKDINTKFKNDFKKTEEEINKIVKERGISIEELNTEVDLIYEKIKELHLKKFGERILPPEGY